MTKRRLGQAVPVLGIALNGGMSAQMANSAFASARDVYRLRFLTDKYALDPATWVSSAPSVDIEDAVRDDVLGLVLDDFLGLPVEDDDGDESP